MHRQVAQRFHGHHSDRGSQRSLPGPLTYSGIATTLSSRRAPNHCARADESSMCSRRASARHQAQACRYGSARPQASTPTRMYARRFTP